MNTGNFTKMVVEMQEKFRFLQRKRGKKEKIQKIY